MNDGTCHLFLQMVNIDHKGLGRYKRYDLNKDLMGRGCVAPSIVRLVVAKFMRGRPLVEWAEVNFVAILREVWDKKNLIDIITEGRERKKTEYKIRTSRQIWNTIYKIKFWKLGREKEWMAGVGLHSFRCPILAVSAQPRLLRILFTSAFRHNQQDVQTKTQIQKQIQKRKDKYNCQLLLLRKLSKQHNQFTRRIVWFRFLLTTLFWHASKGQHVTNSWWII